MNRHIWEIGFMPVVCIRWNEASAVSKHFSARDSLSLVALFGQQWGQINKWDWPIFPRARASRTRKRGSRSLRSRVFARLVETYIYNSTICSNCFFKRVFKWDLALIHSMRMALKRILKNRTQWVSLSRYIVDRDGTNWLLDKTNYTSSSLWNAFYSAK